MARKKPPRGPNPRGAEEAVRSVPRARLSAYHRYWSELVPTTPQEAYYRWAYAVASVNSNVVVHLQTYRFVLRLGLAPGWTAGWTEESLTRAFADSRVGGMFANRSRAFLALDKRFLENPRAFAPGAPDPDDRDLLMAALHGLGPAKTAFALELVDPHGCTAVCMDRHVLRLYGLDPAKVRPADYARAEAHWAEFCRSRGLAPAVARFAVWDALFGRSDCRWWSFVFEPHFDPHSWALGTGPW